MAFPNSVHQAIILNVNPDGSHKIPLRELAMSLGIRPTSAYSILRNLRDRGKIPKANTARKLAATAPAEKAAEAQVADIEARMRSGVMDATELKETLSNWVRGDQPVLQAAGARLLRDAHSVEDRGIAPPEPASVSEIVTHGVPIVAFILQHGEEVLQQVINEARAVLQSPVPSWEAEHEPEVGPQEPEKERPEP